MLLGGVYRGVAVAGTVAISHLAASLAVLVTTAVSLTVADVYATLVTATLVGTVVSIGLVPLYTPRPQPVLTLIRRTGWYVGVACLGLLALNAIDVTVAPEPMTILVTGGLLGFTLPAWFWLCRRRAGLGRVLVVGDDLDELKTVIQSVPGAPAGFLSPFLTRPEKAVSFSESSVERERPATGDATKPVVDDERPPTATDGGFPEVPVTSLSGVQRLSGLSRLEHVLHERDIDTVALAFKQEDREEFFGVLRTCHDNGVEAVVHESLTDCLVTKEYVTEDLIKVELTPWPWYSRMAKRAFDVAFATIALLIMAPLIAIIAIAIKLDSPGPVFYGQTRTTELGEMFPVWKFRSMLPESEDARPGDADDRITRVGRVLRKTHMDEIPQLISILVGDMSVVGPRAAWTEEERLLMRELEEWPRRWVIPPGLTGLAQIRGIDSTDGQAKLECDLEYVRRQSLLFDLRIVLTQIWFVLRDVIELLTSKS